jgi:GNAT superfamily N-acetyltransferase
MIRLAGSDAAIRAACLAGLNQCFPGWGDAAQFDWCNRRPGDPRPADLLVAEADGEIVAGLAVVYRRIGRDDEPHELVGVLSGAWTLPEARGQGQFGRLLDRAAEVARERGATIALAFVTGERSSAGQLDRRSARVIEARLFSRNLPDNFLLVESPATLTPDEAALAFTRRRDRTGQVSIVYDPQSWRDQMIDRAARGRVVRLGDHAIAVLARQGGGSIILDALSLGPTSVPAAETARAALDGRVTIYESDPESFKRYDPTEWTSTKARIFQIPLNSSRYLDGDWKISAGDRL